MNDNNSGYIISKEPSFLEALKYGPLLQKEMREKGKWKFTDKQSIVLLVTLVLDPANDIKEKATSIIIDFFCSNFISNTEKTVS